MAQPGKAIIIVMPMTRAVIPITVTTKSLKFIQERICGGINIGITIFGSMDSRSGVANTETSGS